MQEEKKICGRHFLTKRRILLELYEIKKDIQDWVIAAGNPCRVIRKITEDNRKLYFRDREFDNEAWEDVQRIVEEKRSHDL